MAASTTTKVVLLIAVIAIGLSYLPSLLMARAPLDNAIGVVEELSVEDLRKVVEGKRALVVGGTRGVGRGTALALAQAGAHVTVVGRSAASGSSVMKEMKEVASVSGKQNFQFIQGDLGNVATSYSLLNSIMSDSKKNGLYDYFIQTAAVFPNWESLQQEDNLERGFAIAVVGRYILNRNAFKFLRPKVGRVLNVLASGTSGGNLDRSVASGERNVTSLLEAIGAFGTGFEVMQIGLIEKNLNHGLTFVSTHPGLLKTDLHRGQGWLIDLLEAIVVKLAGISEERCGMRQASILVSPKLHEGGLSYVDQDMKGRARSKQLQDNVDKHLEWLWSFVNKKAKIDA